MRRLLGAARLRARPAARGARGPVGMGAGRRDPGASAVRRRAGDRARGAHRGHRRRSRCDARRAARRRLRTCAAHRVLGLAADLRALPRGASGRAHGVRSRQPAGVTELAAGDLAATWLPEHGMVGASLRHRGAELLGQRGGLAAYLAKGSAFGIPLLAPWANRLDGLGYADVDLDPARVKGGADGLPKDGAMAGRAWTVEDATEATLIARFDAACDGYEDVLAVLPFAHA